MQSPGHASFGCGRGDRIGDEDSCDGHAGGADQEHNQADLPPDRWDPGPNGKKEADIAGGQRQEGVIIRYPNRPTAYSLMKRHEGSRSGRRICGRTRRTTMPALAPRAIMAGSLRIAVNGWMAVGLTDMAVHFQKSTNAGARAEMISCERASDGLDAGVGRCRAAVP
jgi:hypothetical protein